MTDKTISGTDSRENDRLMPCPFCGGNARLTVWTPTASSVSCIMCGAHFNTYTEAEAIEAWNQRDERTCRKMPPRGDTVCIVRRGLSEMEFGYWRCSECGCECFEGARYCMNCGRKVVS